MKKTVTKQLKIQLLFIGMVLFFTACSSSKRTVITTKAEAKKAGVYTAPRKTATIKVPEKTIHTTKTPAPAKAEDIIKTAFSYNGTPYKYGGTTRNGMDCSGLVYTAFTKNNVSLQRSSYLIATQGKRIKLSGVRLGDLVFFITGKNKKRINHVGLVVEIKGSDIKFIHATISRGVLVSSINEKYWKNAFVEARTIL